MSPDVSPDVSPQVSKLLDAVKQHAETTPHVIALEGDDFTLTYAELNKTVATVAGFIQRHNINTVALLVDNGPLWCLADLACAHANLPLVPVPHFFSAAQMKHLIGSAGVDGVLTEHPAQILALLEQLQLDCTTEELHVAGKSLSLIQLNIVKVTLPAGCAKITFTSGSTGEPKGVCLSRHVMDTVAASLATVTGARSSDRHISLLPYATLLENIGGLYAPLLVGATVVSPSLAAVGLSGSSGLDVQRFVGKLIQSQATTCIMIPQMLHALVAAVEAGAPKPVNLRFIAVGGAPVSLALLERSAKLGLPVFEGYGLSEASSVVAVNTPVANRPGSVGKLLPHARIAFAEDGEILVKGGLFSGYLGDAPLQSEYWPTGDIGHMDADGFLYLSGRKKHIFITAFGRNVSPEWVERELSIEPAIAQCCVFGEARPFNVAVIVPRAGVDETRLGMAIALANARLPDYAAVSKWLIADEPFSIQNGLWTGTGRPRRSQIMTAYEVRLNDLYQE
ncbi:MAG: long-chain acyl-CoA synthetase [Zetaproteobacteria bacterium CG_4_9_14_3_um_filter_53_7]|nr:MAG: long-chain acyl-CoA synthetase [Zetaproteobacteria bacterium CG_4_9_14_3_um_filter_53_7]